jgi:hypothetical protein
MRAKLQWSTAGTTWYDIGSSRYISEKEYTLTPILVENRVGINEVLSHRVRCVASVHDFHASFNQNSVEQYYFRLFSLDTTPVYDGFIFTVSGITIEPAVGDTYSNNASVFQIIKKTIVTGAGTLATARISGTNNPNASGNLIQISGMGDATIAYSAYTTSVLLYGIELGLRKFSLYFDLKPQGKVGYYNRRIEIEFILAKTSFGDYSTLVMLPT